MNLIKNFFSKKKIINEVINFNKNLFSKNKINNDSIILTEFSTNKSIQAGFSLFLHSLQKKTGCKIYSFNNDLRLFDKKKQDLTQIRKFVDQNYQIYNSFNVQKFINVSFDKNIFLKAQKKSKLLLKKIKTKKQLLNLKIENIWVGDLLYDSYLKDENMPTVNLELKIFKKYFFRFTYLIYFWIDFFEKNKINFVITSHTVYSSAIPIRIALSKNLTSYQVNFHNVFRLNQKKLFAYDLFHDYKKIFNSLEKKVQVKAYSIAEKQCRKRFGGEIGIDMYYSKKSAYSGITKKRVLKNNKKKKILIAAHCFLDNPHPYGIESIFCDFYEWLDYLGKISKKTNYDWYIKTHPDFHKKTHALINQFISKYPNITLLPSHTSHHNIISEGIGCVLTVHGTIAWEYAYFKIPAICASQNNPHINFDFAYHAKNRRDLTYAIKNFQKLKLNFSKKNIYKFYFMHNIYQQSNWMIKDLDKNLRKIGGYKNISSMEFYKFWLKYRTNHMNNKTHLQLSNFLNTSDFFISREI